MKVKFIATMLLLLSLATNVMGQDGKNSLGRGYRGFVETEEWDNFAVLNVSTTHGYQFNPNIYVGVGVVGISWIGGSDWVGLANFRYDATIKDKFTPFIDVNTYIEKDYEFNIHPSVGYRFKHFNVKVGYLMDGEGDGGLTFGIGFDFGGRKKK